MNLQMTCYHQLQTRRGIRYICVRGLGFMLVELLVATAVIRDPKSLGTTRGPD